MAPIRQITRALLAASVALSFTMGCRNAPKIRADDKSVTEGRSGARATPAQAASAIAVAADAANAGFDAATARAVGWRKLPSDAPWRKIIEPNRAPKGSFSAGTVADGTLLGSAELPKKGEFHSIIERHQRHKTRWATKELVDLIQGAARHVYTTEGGAPLRVGNMSKKKGGDIRWSRSHNSGRDADLAFYVVAADTGESVAAPDLLRFDERGIPGGREDLRFDVARNWRLVEGLLTQTETNVQWLFISIPLKTMLLAHAATSGADPEVVRRASQVLHQPTDAPPHADHFHLRIGCSRDDRLDGCLDYGPQWDWLDWHKDALLARAVRLGEAFDEGKLADRVRALEFLDQTGSPFAADVAGVWGLWDADAAVRKLALDVATSQYGWSANALVQVQKFVSAGAPDGRELRQAYQILRQSRDPMSRDFAVSRLVDPAVSPAERAHAAGALGHFMEPELVEVLVAQLTDPDPSVRVAVADVLRRITNRSEGVDWSSTPDAAAAGQQAWRAWLSAQGDATREAWIAAGFRKHGVAIEASPLPQHIDGLMGLLEAEEPWLRYNANRTIREITGRWAPLEQSDGKALTKYWSKWWKKNRDRVLSGEIGGDA